MDLHLVPVEVRQYGWIMKCPCENFVDVSDGGGVSNGIIMPIVVITVPDAMRFVMEAIDDDNCV